MDLKINSLDLSLGIELTAPITPPSPLRSTDSYSNPETPSQDPPHHPPSNIRRPTKDGKYEYLINGQLCTVPIENVQKTYEPDFTGWTAEKRSEG